MARDYQYDYSEIMPSVYDREARERKALTTLAVLEDFFDEPLAALSCLDVGGSTGVIDHRLAQELGRVVGIDIDQKAINYARQNFVRDNLEFDVGDAMQLAFADDSFDVVICSHVYEHVPDAEQLMAEIYRVLRPGGACYFSGNVRIMINEPHYNLPFLSLLPRPLAHLYLRVTGKGRYYHEKHLGYGALRRLMAAFEVHNYTARVIAEPDRYRVEYMLPAGSLKARLAGFVARRLPWMSPCIWLLVKPGR
jgi:ubiquinone/menaquinone biosynthesis C-methylase UbiE